LAENYDTRTRIGKPWRRCWRLRANPSAIGIYGSRILPISFDQESSFAAPLNPLFRQHQSNCDKAACAGRVLVTPDNGYDRRLSHVRNGLKNLLGLNPGYIAKTVGGHPNQRNE
jgi:hypothetical protein